LPNPIERCYYAIERNLHLLTDYNKTKELADQNHSRFQHNLDLLRSNVCLKECFAQLDKCTPEVRIALLKIMPEFRHKMFEKDFKDHVVLGTPSGNNDYNKTGLV